MDLTFILSIKIQFMKKSLCLTTSIGCFLLKWNFFWQDENIFPWVSLLWIYFQVLEFSNLGFWLLFWISYHSAALKFYHYVYKILCMKYIIEKIQFQKFCLLTGGLWSISEENLYNYKHLKFYIDILNNK